VAQTDRIDELAAEVAQLRDLFQRRLLEDRARQRLYDELCAQLEWARSDIEARAVAPVAREVLLIVDRIETFTGAEDSQALGEALDTVAQELLEILSRRGLRRVDDVGTPFDPRVHEAVDRVAVAADDHGRVVSVRRAGFLLGSQLVRPVRVVVGHHTPHDGEPRSQHNSVPAGQPNSEA
jgi:molecular chaperone GrpE